MEGGDSSSMPWRSRATCRSAGPIGAGKQGGEPMKIKISGKQMDVGDALTGHVEARLEEAVTKYFDRPVSATVVFSRDVKSFFKTEVLVSLATGLQARAEGSAHDVYAAFEQATDRIEKQVRRYKRRLKNHHQRQTQPIDVIAAAAYVLPADADDDEDTGAAGEDAPTIIAETKAEIQTLSVGDAVMQMELRHAPFLLFRNTATGRLNVVFQRDDGHVGWVDPDLARETVTA
ncbi:MAG: ribosome-associated translation inhibitor RaiA [Pseudomonadota bacterium]